MRMCASELNKGSLVSSFELQKFAEIRSRAENFIQVVLSMKVVITRLKQVKIISFIKIITHKIGAILEESLN